VAEHKIGTIYASDYGKGPGMVICTNIDENGLHHLHPWPRSAWSDWSERAIKINRSSLESPDCGWRPLEAAPAVAPQEDR
jgi:hypothetical protein